MGDGVGLGVRVQRKSVFSTKIKCDFSSKILWLGVIEMNDAHVRFLPRSLPKLHEERVNLRATPNPKIFDEKSAFNPQKWRSKISLERKVYTKNAKKSLMKTGCFCGNNRFFFHLSSIRIIGGIKISKSHFPHGGRGYFAASSKSNWNLHKTYLNKQICRWKQCATRLFYLMKRKTYCGGITSTLLMKFMI